MERTKVLVVGGGRGGLAVLRACQDRDDVTVVGVCDLDGGAPALAWAREAGIPTYARWRDGLAEGPDVVFEVTGNRAVAAELRVGVPEGTSVVDARAARLLTDLVERHTRATQVAGTHGGDLAGRLASLSTRVNALDVALRAQSGTSSADGDREGVLQGAAAQVNENLKKTDEILEVIQAVARRSKVLGINASIEASRAGELGRGFDVVAQEIRNLAETSRRSVDEAAVVVAAIRDSVQRMVAGLDRPVGEEHRTPAVEAAADLQRALGDVRALVDRMRGGL